MKTTTVFFFSQYHSKILLQVFSSKEIDEGNEQSLLEEMKEDTKRIISIVKRKWRRKRKMKVLKRLDDLTAKAERCSGRSKIKSVVSCDQDPYLACNNRRDFKLMHWENDFII